MPPKTRRTAATTGNQSTLSFKNKITKSNVTSDATHKKAQKLELSEPAEDEVAQAIEIKQSTPEPEPAATKSKTPKGKAQNEPQVKLNDSPSASPKKRKKSRKSGDYESDPSDSYTAAEAQALKVSDAQIKKYWKAEEDARLAPRVHQSHLPIQEKILRHFDLSSQYGPCIGITRLSRWKRAHSLGQDPPVEVLSVLLKEEEKEKTANEKKTGNGEGARLCGKIAYIDELAGGKVVLVE